MFDSGPLRTMTRKPLIATGAHVCVLAHIGKIELVKSLSTIETANGLGNRFLWAWVRRSKVLPDGGNLDERDLAESVEQMRHVLDFAQTVAGRAHTGSR